MIYRVDTPDDVEELVWKRRLLQISLRYDNAGR
jgi:hypothetical protein